MGKIDKEKLLETLEPDDVKCTGLIFNIIENFPEEPTIDFGLLKKEWQNTPEDGTPYVESFVEFLKSKNLTVPKPIEIPVKRYWKLKPEFQEFSVLFEVDEGINFRSETYDAKYAKYYDEIKEPDYSKINENSIIEAEGKLFYFHCVNSLGWPSLKKNKSDTSSTDEYSKNGIRVVELAKE